MSGGVRNLRAMFESRDESSTSPPDRGRSPAGSTGGGSNGTSPRPISKVRTNFITVERNGQLGSQWGLRKENNTDHGVVVRRASFSIDEESDPKAVAEMRDSIRSEMTARKSNPAVVEMIPENALETPPVESAQQSSYLNGKTGLARLAPAVARSIGKQDKDISIEEQTTKLLLSGTKSHVTVTRDASLSNGGGSRDTVNGIAAENTKPVSSAKGTSKPIAAGRSARPAPIATSSGSTTTKPSSKPTKSPATPRTPTTPGKIPTTPGKSGRAPSSKLAMASASLAQKKSLERKDSKSALSSASSSRPPPRPSTSSTTPSASEKKAAHSSPGGFHKPKPRSPTRPARLPASLTAPTSSSLSKVSTTAAVPTRQSLAPSIRTISRSSSRTSLAPKVELRRKPSSLNNDRPALGRPPTTSMRKQPSRQSLSKAVTVADEGFLARMMRPTTSSASKTADKIVTPPRKVTVTRPITFDGPSKPHGGPKDFPISAPTGVSTARQSEAVAEGHVEEAAVEGSGITEATPNVTINTVGETKFQNGERALASEKEPQLPTGDSTVQDKTTLRNGIPKNINSTDVPEAINPEVMPERAAALTDLEQKSKSTDEPEQAISGHSKPFDIQAPKPVVSSGESETKKLVPHGIVDESQEEEEEGLSVKDSEATEVA